MHHSSSKQVWAAVGDELDTMRALVEPSDQAAAVVWLCSDLSNIGSGVNTHDGGWLAGSPDHETITMRLLRAD